MSLRLRAICGRASSWLSIFTAIDGCGAAGASSAVPRSGLNATATGGPLSPAGRAAGEGVRHRQATCRAGRCIR
jgi:hypothetical protein